MIKSGVKIEEDQKLDSTGDGENSPTPFKRDGEEELSETGEEAGSSSASGSGSSSPHSSSFSTRLSDETEDLGEISLDEENYACSEKSDEAMEEVRVDPKHRPFKLRVTLR